MADDTSGSTSHHDDPMDRVTSYDISNMADKLTKAVSEGLTGVCNNLDEIDSRLQDIENLDEKAIRIADALEELVKLKRRKLTPEPALAKPQPPPLSRSKPISDEMKTLVELYDSHYAKEKAAEDEKEAKMVSAAEKWYKEHWVAVMERAKAEAKWGRAYAVINVGWDTRELSALIRVLAAKHPDLRFCSAGHSNGLMGVSGWGK